MKCILSIFVLLSSFVNCYAQSKYKQKLDNVAIIEFPDTPKLTKHSIAKIYTCVNNNVIYLAESSDLETSLKDLLLDNNTDTVYSKYIKGYLKSLKGSIVNKKYFTINKITGVEYTINAKLNNLDAYGCHRLLYFDDKLVSFGILTTDSSFLKRNDVEPFLNSLKLTTNQVMQSRSERIGFILGKGLAFFLMISSLLAVGVGVIFLIRKIMYKKR